ncbi:MAG: hypothetical protein GXP47_14225, partial [Acidobacteria bacterium]|nr:hypothetical protein [Acidobacteriota bacterium]
MAPWAEAAAPCRADLAGGTLDIWPLGVLHPGALTVNAALPVRARVRVEAAGAPAGTVLHVVGGGAPRSLEAADSGSDLTAAVAFFFRPGGGLVIRVLEQVPVGSGLGGSSAYALALARALLVLDGRSMDGSRLIPILRDLEARVLGAPAGCQDHWAAEAGGVLALHLGPGGERLERLPVDLDWVGRRLTVFFTGITHHSGMVNWQIIRRRFEGDAGTALALDEIAAAARRCRSALLAPDEAAVGEAVAADWTARRRLAPEVCPPELDRIVVAARAGGALAVKAC